MDKDITIDEVKKFVSEFCLNRNWGQFHNLKDLAIGISTEANELLQIFRFKSKHEIEVMTGSDRWGDICDEIADVFYFVLLFALNAGIDLSEALERKLKKNGEKYPIEKAKDNNKKYDEYER